MRGVLRTTAYIRVSAWQIYTMSRAESLSRLCGGGGNSNSSNKHVYFFLATTDKPNRRWWERNRNRPATAETTLAYEHTISTTAAGKQMEPPPRRRLVLYICTPKGRHPQLNENSPNSTQQQQRMNACVHGSCRQGRPVVPGGGREAAGAWRRGMGEGDDEEMKEAKTIIRKRRDRRRELDIQRRGGGATSVVWLERDGGFFFIWLGLS
jgi:hypothetical protein